MIIRKLSASFGCLENESMELHEGLNIIYAPNESGKSTWCAFIRAMLYGIDSSQREKGGVKPDKVKYAPWSGAAMSGEMEIEQQGRAITLRRSTKTAAAPMREFSATYSGTADPVPGLKGSDAGEKLTGIPKAVFESSLFVRQSGLAVSSSVELEKRINAIISTGEDEAVSYTDADASLRGWLRKRRYNRSGAIPAADADIAEKQSALSAMSEALRQREKLEKSLESAEASERQAAEAARLGAERRRSRLIAQVERARLALDAAEKQLGEERERSIRLSAETEKGPFAGMDAREARAAAGADAKNLIALKKAVSGYSPAIALAALILGACVILAGILTLNTPVFYIAGAVLMPAGIIALLIRRGKKKEADAFALAMAHRYGNPDPDSILEKAEAHAAACAAAEKARAEALHGERAVADARAALRQAETELLEGKGTVEPPAPIGAESELIRRRIALTEGRLEAMGDPMVIATELEALQSRRRELSEQYEALSLAISTLRDANDELQQRFSPALGRRAGEIMSALTGGRYSGLSFSRELDATARREGDAIAHEKAFLSQGTADQLYLALRLAICELALPEGCSCPIILDDALVNFDNERMGYALELLSELSKERQIILFTCHEREAAWLRSRDRD